MAKLQQGKDHHVFLEKLILNSLKSDLIIRLDSTFHDTDSLYFILEYVDRGELATFISKKGMLDFDLLSVYFAEYVC